MVDRPYKETQQQSGRDRTFSADVDPQLLTWHRDHHCRDVTVLSGLGWQFQFDNQLPFELVPGISWHIPAGIYHRLHAGTEDLSIHLVELRSTGLECSVPDSQTDHAAHEHRIYLCDRCAA